MSFSASPLVPDQQAGDEGWTRSAQAIAAAATEALPQIPSAQPLVVGEALPDVTPTALPGKPGAAITGFLGGGIEGKVLLVVGEDLVEALAGTPFGALEPAKALRPALDTLAAALGGRLEGEPTPIEVADCLDVLNGGVVVVLPLTAGGGVGAMLGVSLSEPPQAAAAPAAAAGAAAGAASVPALPTAATAASSWGIDMLRDVEMEVTCELGRTRMTVRQLLALAPGDVVELDRLAGAPADLLVNGTLLARGEVVVVDESFGLRITEIVTRDAT